MATEEVRLDRHQAVVRSPKLQKNFLLGRIKSAGHRFGSRFTWWHIWTSCSVPVDLSSDTKFHAEPARYDSRHSHNRQAKVRFNALLVSARRSIAPRHSSVMVRVVRRRRADAGTAVLSLVIVRENCDPSSARVFGTNLFGWASSGFSGSGGLVCSGDFVPYFTSCDSDRGSVCPEDRRTGHYIVPFQRRFEGRRTARVLHRG
jgi:hypothetical protein